MKQLSLLVFVVLVAVAIADSTKVDANEKMVKSIHHRSKRSTSVHMSASEIQIVLDYHNNLRRSSGASDMLELKWSPSIAQVAEDYCDLCTFNHLSLDPSGTGYSELGQNLYTNPAGVDLYYVVSRWAGEKAFYNLTANTCTDGEMCGHYRAMVWAKTKEIGCSYKICSSISGAGSGAFGAIVACQYGPIGNYPSQKPYVPGPACSGCPPGTQCKNALCTDDCTTESPCDCETTCKHGTLNSLTCTCDCNDGYMGDRCDIVCKDLSTYCYVYWPAFFCTYGPETEFTHVECPHMCNKCRSRCDEVRSKCQHGTTVVGTNKFTDCHCQCESGWTGEYCDYNAAMAPAVDLGAIHCNQLETDVDQGCRPGGHVVVAQDGTCTCQCYNQYTGERCKSFNSPKPNGVVSVTYVRNILRGVDDDYTDVFRALRYEAADYFNGLCYADVRRCCIGAETEQLSPTDLYAYVTSVLYDITSDSNLGTTTFVFYASDTKYNFCAKAVMASFPNFNP